MSNILIPAGANLTSDQVKLQMASMREKKDLMIIEAISRSVGHTDWKYDQISHLMDEREYPDGSSVFAFRGRDMLLFEPQFFLDGHITQPVQYLYDKTDFKYKTYEERADLGYFDMPVDEGHDENGLAEIDRIRAGILNADEEVGDDE